MFLNRLFVQLRQKTVKDVKLVFCSLLLHLRKVNLPLAQNCLSLTDNIPIWCFRPYKPNIFWKLMTPTIHWPTDHSPITHTDPSDPPNPPRTQLTWPFLHFMTLPVCSIQTLYFLKPHGIYYPLTHFIDHFPITHTDPSDPPLHGIVWPSESRTVVQRLVSVVFVIIMIKNIISFISILKQT